MNSRLTVDRALDRGAFLGRLWSQLGPAASRDGGFEYYVRDQESGLDFVAYSGPSGPAYAGALDQRFALRRVIEAFEDLLEQTSPADCAIEYTAERDYGGGKWVLGWKDGRSFDVPDRRNRRGSAPVERRSHRAR